MDDISPHPINVGLWCLDHQNINHCKDVNVPTSTNQITTQLGLDSGEILPNPMILAPLHIPPFPIVSLLFWIKKKKKKELWKFLWTIDLKITPISLKRIRRIPSYFIFCFAFSMGEICSYFIFWLSLVLLFLWVTGQWQYPYRCLPGEIRAWRTIQLLIVMFGVVRLMARISFTCLSGLQNFSSIWFTFKDSFCSNAYRFL